MMMKRLSSVISVAALLWCMPPLLSAQTEETVPAAAEVPAVHKAVGGMAFFNGSPAADAKYYIYLHSASWCGPCRQEMPYIVEEYKKMKEERVELILVGHDRSREEAQAYLEEFKAGFSGVMDSGKPERALPGDGRVRGIPTAFLVTADGERVHAGHANFVATGKWQEVIKAYEQRKAETPRH